MEHRHDGQAVETVLVAWDPARGVLWRKASGTYLADHVALFAIDYFCADGRRLGATDFATAGWPHTVALVAVTAGVSDTLTLGAEYKFGGTDSGWKVSGSNAFTVSLQACYTHTWESGVEDARMAQTENSEIETKSLTNTETAASGSISTVAACTNVTPCLAILD